MNNPQLRAIPALIWREATNVAQTRTGFPDDALTTAFGLLWVEEASPMQTTHPNSTITNCIVKTKWEKPEKGQVLATSVQRR